MHCPSCHAQLHPNVRFCGICGHKLPRGPSEFVHDDEVATEIDPQQRFVPDGDNNDPFAGMVLNNRFLVEQKLGEGGFGAVYKGTQTGTGRKVAIKLLHPNMTRDDNLVARFRREGLVLCNLRDAHTVTTYDFDQTADGTLYIAMELLEGKSLHDVFQDDAPLDWRRMFKILTEMCSSLAEAHAQGIVHRDLKPENILLESRPGHPDFVKILDFGIAKVMRGDSVGGKATQLTATGQTLGTLEYMSPEQLMGKALDGRSDIYALGVLAYEMITGRLPFPDAKGPAGLITAQLRQVPEPPSSVNLGGSIPAAADEIILKMLAKTPEGRFDDVSVLRDVCLKLLAQPQQAPQQHAILPGQQGGSSLADLPPSYAGQRAHQSGPQASPPPPPPPPPSSRAVSAPPLTIVDMSQQEAMQSSARSGGQQHTMQPPVHPSMQQHNMQPPGQQGGHGQPHYFGQGAYAAPSYAPPAHRRIENWRLWLWIVLGIIALGGVVGAVLALA